eukprot:TRINITY_DN11573_c0_g1_i1.p1 TRINITY_DN11573_c0_g1~~TRINITY_DN11573_c0_g1_i1.p1  ORF type:complete len:261 (+),score=81.07 TRINITY_DN11573_c0_g1_i1:60-842(+)
MAHVRVAGRLLCLPRSGAAVGQQVRYRSLRDAIHDKQLREAQQKRSEHAALEADLKGLDADLRAAHHEYDLKSTGYAEVDQRARQAEEVVAAMSEEEIRENQEIIKNMLVRGLRAFGVAVLGIAIAVYAYRKKRLEMAEKKREADGPEVDVSVTLREFQQTVSDAMAEQSEEPVEVNHEPAAWYTVKYWKKSPAEDVASAPVQPPGEDEGAVHDAVPVEAGSQSSLARPSSEVVMKVGASVAAAAAVAELLRLFCLPSRK